MSRDHDTFADPCWLCPPSSHRTLARRQPVPGIQAHPHPVIDLGEQTYRGTGRLAGRKALVTGQPCGVAGAVAIAFAREGADVAISYPPYQEQDARHIVSVVEDAGRIARAHPSDVLDRCSARALVDTAVAGLGGLDIVAVSGVARYGWGNPVTQLSPEQFEDAMRIHVVGMFWLLQAALPHLTPGASIIWSSSGGAADHELDHQPSSSPNEDIGGDALGTLATLSTALARQLGPGGIRVNALAADPLWTRPPASHPGPPRGPSRYPEGLQFGRPEQPALLAPIFAFLASAESDLGIGETRDVNRGPRAGTATTHQAPTPLRRRRQWVGPTASLRARIKAGSATVDIVGFDVEGVTTATAATWRPAEPANATRLQTARRWRLRRSTPLRRRRTRTICCRRYLRRGGRRRGGR